MNRIKKWLVNVMAFPTISFPHIWLQKLVAVLAFWPHKPSYDVKELDFSGHHYNDYMFTLNKTAEKILGTRKFQKYQAIIDKKRQEGLLHAFMVTTSRGNRVFCVKLDYKRNIIRKDNYDDPYVRPMNQNK